MDGHVGRARGEDESRPIERWREGSPHSNQRAREGQWERGRALGTRRAGQRVTPNVLLFDGDNHGVRPTPALAPAARATVDDSQSLRRSHRPVASVFAVRGVGSMRVVRLRRPCRSLYWDGRGLSIGGHLAAAFGAGATRTRRPVGGSRCACQRAAIGGANVALARVAPTCATVHRLTVEQHETHGHRPADDPAISTPATRCYPNPPACIAKA